MVIPTSFLLSWLLLVFASTIAFASSDPSPMQDFCVGDPNGPVHVNGFACKDPKLVVADDFFFSGLHKPSNTSVNPQAYGVTPVTAVEIPGLNTLGISIARIDFSPNGVNPPHTHPRATEVLTVLEGTLYAGFITSFPELRLITKTLQKGDVFVFPQALVHFQHNVGNNSAAVIVALSSQNPGVITVADAVFGSNPPILDCTLAKAFQVDNSIISLLKSQFRRNGTA